MSGHLMLAVGGNCSWAVSQRTPTRGLFIWASVGFRELAGHWDPRGVQESKAQVHGIFTIWFQELHSIAPAISVLMEAVIPLPRVKVWESGKFLKEHIDRSYLSIFGKHNLPCLCFLFL